MSLTHWFIPLTFLALFALSAAPLHCCAAGEADAADDTRVDQPKELGRVHWMRDFDAALARSKTTGKPVAILFQEVPGCSTCQNFGDAPLSSPLIVAALEQLFVPVAIYNNVGGEDARVLKRYNEPTWNNPVMRFVSSSGEDVIPRKDGVYATTDVTLRLIAALTAAHQPVPKWLELARQESRGTKLERSTFEMHCYWEGEAHLGRLDGVVATRAAWLDGKEVVEVTWDPSVTDADTVFRAAQKMECARHIYATSEEQLESAQKLVGDDASVDQRKAKSAKASDRKYRLRNTFLRTIPMTPGQAMKVNAALAYGDDWSDWLTPSQLLLADQVKQFSDEHDIKSLKTAPWTTDAITLDRARSELVKAMDDARKSAGQPTS